MDHVDTASITSRQLAKARLIDTQTCVDGEDLSEADLEFGSETRWVGWCCAE